MTRTRGTMNSVRLVGWMVAAVVVLVACGEGATEVADGAVTPTAAPTAEPTTETTPTTPAGTPTPLPSPRPTPNLDGLVPVSVPAMGGLRLGVAEDVRVIIEGDYVGVLTDDRDGQVVIALVGTTTGPDRITTVDEVLDAAREYAAVTVEESGEILEVLGQTLAGYELRGDPADVPPGQGLFGGRTSGVQSNTFWTPAPLADIYLGPAPGGVLAVGTVAQTPEGLASAQVLLDAVLPTVHLLTVDQTIEPAGPDFIDFPEGDLDYPRVPALDDGSLPLLQVFSPLEAGTYQNTNLSMRLKFEIDDQWWVAPNFRGYLVLVEGGLTGPGQRDVVFHQGVKAIAGVRSGLNPDGDLVLIDDLDSFLASPPPTLLVSGVAEVTVSGLPATQFDLRIEPLASCQLGSPCAYQVLSPDRFVGKDVKAAVVHRFWWIDDVPAGPLVISASTFEPDAPWLDDRVAELIESIELS